MLIVSPLLGRIQTGVHTRPRLGKSILPTGPNSQTEAFASVSLEAPACSLPAASGGRSECLVDEAQIRPGAQDGVGVRLQPDGEDRPVIGTEVVLDRQVPVRVGDRQVG